MARCWDFRQPVKKFYLLAIGAVVWLGVDVVPVRAEKQAEADVVVVVDTSVSMREPGMDPERTSLLVTQLLADIVPGKLAAVRLLDLVADSDLLPSRETGESMPCAEDPTQMCGRVEAASDWQEDAREKLLGVLVRQERGNPEYKEQLEQHLRQESNNSMFHLAFRAAQGVFDQGEDETPKVAIWLSDGRTDEEWVVREAINQLRRDGVKIEAIVFGQGDLRLAQELSLEPRQVTSPHEIMAAFADAFRTIVQAPFRLGDAIARSPSFDMKPNVDEAWIVIYGDDTLANATLEGPDGEIAADDAASRWPGAGAYRVAHLSRPTSGSWTVRARGGGKDVAYAVVQRSALHPTLLSPAETISGVEVLLEAGVRAGLDGELLNDAEVLGETTLQVSFQGANHPLRDDGTAGDAQAGDGRYSARVRFRESGPVEVAVELKSPLVQRTTTGTVLVKGIFVYDGEAVLIDLGAIKAGEETCRSLAIPAERQGQVPLVLRSLRDLPGAHAFYLRFPGGSLVPGGDSLLVAAEDAADFCLHTERHAADSQAVGEPWFELKLAGSEEASHAMPIALRFSVSSLSFWELWGKVILLILALLLLAFIAGGYFWPNRFQRALALTFVPEVDELDEQSPQPVAQWRGVGIGFYSHARAFLHPDFRLSGQVRGAISSLHAEKHATRVQASRGSTLFKQTLDGEWEAIQPEGRRARPGDVYRVGEKGPFFRITLQGSRR